MYDTRRNYGFSTLLTLLPRQLGPVAACIILTGCGFSIGGGGNDNGTLASQNASVQEIMDLESALAVEKRRADTAEQAAQRAREEADWMLQAAQDRPQREARLKELEEDVARLMRANTVLVQENAETTGLRDRVSELLAQVTRLSEANAALQSATPDRNLEPSPSAGNIDPAIELPALPRATTSPSGPNAGTGSYGLHLASYRASDELSRGWAHYKELYPEVVGSLDAISVMLDVAGFGGAYYRLIAGPLSDEAGASALCAMLKARQEYCVVAEFSSDGEPVPE